MKATGLEILPYGADGEPGRGQTLMELIRNQSFGDSLRVQALFPRGAWQIQDTQTFGLTA